MHDFEQLDDYQILGVDRAAAPDEIKRAYRQAISLYHPDRFIGKSAAEQQYAIARTQRITEAYRTLGEQKSRVQLGSSKGASRPAPAQPPQPRDHVAELYAQAIEHMQAQRYLQAAAVLRQLQQLSPFYRDSAQLLAQAEQQAGAQGGPPTRRRRPLLIFGGLLVGGLLVALGLRSLGRSTAAQPPAPSAVIALAPSSAPSAAPTMAPTAAPSIAPTVAPTAAPSPVPTLAPTAAPSAAPTAAPTAPATLAPSPASSEAALEAGAVLDSNSLVNGSGWAVASGNGWSVGDGQGGYRITAAPGIGEIWSYRTLPAGEPLSIGVDVLVNGGQAGLVSRFIDGNNYLSFSVNPAADSFVVMRYRGGAPSVLVSDNAGAALKPGEFNRLVVALRDGNAQFAINGTVVASLDLQAPADSGRYGLVASGTDAPADALFANLAIHALP